MYILELPIIRRHLAGLAANNTDAYLFIGRIAQRYAEDEGNIRYFVNKVLMPGLGRHYRFLQDSGNDNGHKLSLMYRCFANSLAEHCLNLSYGMPSLLYSQNFKRLTVSRALAFLDSNKNAEDYDACFDMLREEYDLYACDDCGTICSEATTVRHGYSICSSCLHDNYSFCEDISEWVQSEYAVAALSANGHEIFIYDDSSEDYEFDEERGMLVHVDFVDNSVIRGYHSSKSDFSFKRDEWTTKHRRFLGVELEVESNGSDNKARIAKRIHEAVNSGGRKVFFERDGSLSDGFEMVTNPMSLPALRDLFTFLNTDLIKGLRSHNTSSCGLHIHVSKDNLTALQIQKVVAFVNSPANEWFIRGLARRYSTGFCRVMDKKVGKGIHASHDRYEAVNVTNNKTIEFRIFRGSLKYEAVVAAMEFCHAILEFCRPANTGINQLSAGAFLSFCATQLAVETRVMRNYISQRLKGRGEILDQEAA
jgi:hypothetical protein